MPRWNSLAMAELAAPLPACPLEGLGAAALSFLEGDGEREGEEEGRGGEARFCFLCDSADVPLPEP